jgi:hypothetical protein
MTRKIQDASAVKLPRVTKGKRPYFFADQSIDQVMTFFLELMTEVLVLRDRQDTLERLLDEKGAVNRADIRSYIPSSDVEAERTAERAAFVSRVLRIHSPEGRADDEGASG